MRNGVYREKLFVTKSRLAIVGEDREKTRIEYAELRREWRKTHPDDWGAAVVNVGDDVTDLVLANLTIRNDYGARTGDRDHQFAIRSGGNATRIVLLHANVIADGGDTVSLWNAFTGMTYHAFCTFEGWVDFVCPRGTSYVTNSRFVAHSPTAAIWHDGSKDRDHRFVVRSSRFEGDPGFPLGRNNRDGQFYILDGAFSASDGRPADLPAVARPRPTPGSRGPTSTAAAETTATSPGSPTTSTNADFSPSAAEITPEWTFCGQWDPEGTMPAVLPFAAVPRPHDGARDVPLFGAVLRWVAARGATALRALLRPGRRAARAWPASRGRAGRPARSPRGRATRGASTRSGPAGRVRGETWTLHDGRPPVPHRPRGRLDRDGAAGLGHRLRRAPPRRGDGRRTTRGADGARRASSTRGTGRRSSQSGPTSS